MSVCDCSSPSVAVLALLCAAAGILSPALAQGPDALEQARQFIAEHEKTVRPLEKACSLAWWNANVSGKEEDFKAKEEAQNRLDAVLADPERFGRLRRIRQQLAALPGVDNLVLRQIELLYLQYLEKQVDPALLQRMTALSNAAERAFNIYRARVEGRELTDSQVRKILRESKDSAYRRTVWESAKGVGAVVEPHLRELVRLRNQATRKLGFADYYEMQLQLSELSKQQVNDLFERLHELTAPLLRARKAQIDAKLAADYGIDPSELRPWHYHDPFFQEAPAIYNTNFDALYAGADIVRLCRDFYAGIGLDVAAVLARSDLFEKPGKCPHAFCTDIDLEGDVRVLANIVPNEYWMGTTLHELGHAVYSTPNVPLSLPYVLRSNAHSFATEGVAMLFERFAQDGQWMQAVGLSVPDVGSVAEIGRQMRRDRLLIFAGFSQVMVRFEQAMYENPDQDLNRLWWDLAEKYQLLRRPEGRNAPDYAAKIHITTSPAYYHNYMMGEMFAAQLHRAIAHEVLKEDSATSLYNGRKEVGEFLRNRLFALGRTVRWDRAVRQATGQDLSPAALAQELGAR